MQTLEIKTYSFAELNKAAKQSAIEAMKNSEYYPWDDWHDAVLQDWKTDLEAYGYDDADIEYSGFSSQGDGASFTAIVNLEAWLRQHKLLTKYRKLLKASESFHVGFKIERESAAHYVHEYMICAVHDVEMAADNWDELDEQAGELVELMTEDARKLSRKIYKALEAEYDWHMDEEQIVGMIEANEYRYTNEGKTTVGL